MFPFVQRRELQLFLSSVDSIEQQHFSRIRGHAFLQKSSEHSFFRLCVNFRYNECPTTEHSVWNGSVCLKSLKTEKDGPYWFGTGFMIKKPNDFVWILDMSKNLTVWQPNECQNVKNDLICKLFANISITFSSVFTSLQWVSEIQTSVDFRHNNCSDFRHCLRSEPKVQFSYPFHKSLDFRYVFTV